MKQIKPQEFRDGFNDLLVRDRMSVLMIEDGNIYRVTGVSYIEQRFDYSHNIGFELFDGVRNNDLLDGKVFAFVDGTVRMLQRGKNCTLSIYREGAEAREFRFDYDDLTGKQTGGIPWCYEFDEGVVKYFLSKTPLSGVPSKASGIIFIVE